MTQRVGQGGQITTDVYYRLAGTATLIDPDDPLYDIIDPDDTEVVTNGVPVRESLGHYNQTYQVAAAAPLGVWRVHWTGTINDVPVEGDDYFEVVAAGTVTFPTGTLPPFAAVEQLETRLGKTLVDAELGRAQAALEDASTKIRAEAGTTWVDSAGQLAAVPDIVVTVCLSAARRVIENPEGLSQETTGSYSSSWPAGSNDVYLTSAEKRAVRRAAGKTGLWAQPTTRGALETRSLVCNGGETLYLDVDPAGQPIPWAGPDGY